ncbi:hypothetical protein BKA70DRAFT_1574133 [Coprinopsis sp. MPI-PUGE-AT-0042]|nr:hypothetical protein BKA70DRAFT_1574133 [Coprinopsis sp. MPI-PUGE-AT-0042]
MSSMLSPPSSPMDHRHYIPRRPSPLSLPPMAPTISLGAASEGFQPFTLSALGFDSPKTGAKLPRYPLEKQRRAWKEFEDQKQQKDQQQMQRQPPMQLTRQGSSSRDYLSPTSTLPLTPRSGASSASSRYSVEDSVDDSNNGKSKTSGQRTFCTVLFGSCFAAFRTASSTIENTHKVHQVMSAR